ncbi:MAG TPA: class I SAM-dependent methyltransferase [Gemmatimonadales bacterium]|jgi:magnesium-protoporphyrin O-methyltransferase
MLACCHSEAIDRHFGAARAAEELARYRKRGPSGTARLMLRAIRELRPPADSLLDIGAGIGVLHHELLAGPVGLATHVEAARAYVEAAKGESLRRGQAERIQFRHGDFLALSPTLPDADLVTLDRVVCCYPELDPMVRVSMAKARRYYAISFPHDRWYVRIHTAWQNLRRRRAGNPFRTFVHSPSRIHALLAEGGMRVMVFRQTLVWQVFLCARS